MNDNGRGNIDDGGWAAHLNGVDADELAKLAKYFDASEPMLRAKAYARVKLGLADLVSPPSTSRKTWSLAKSSSPSSPSFGASGAIPAPDRRRA